MQAYPISGPEPDGTFNPSTLFWQHELLHRATLQDYNHRLECYRKQRNNLGQTSLWTEHWNYLNQLTKEERLAFSARCFAEASEAEKEWLEIVNKTNPKARAKIFFTQAWKNFNLQAKLEDKI